MDDIIDESPKPNPSSSDPSSNMDDFPPHHFRCPISMELMTDPVTISTGVSYERKNIEKWFFTYNKKTCPATMQPISDLNSHITPNLTLKSLILSWQNKNKNKNKNKNPPPNIDPDDHHPHHQSSSSISNKHDEIVSLLNTIQSSLFKVASLRKLRSLIEIGDHTKTDFVSCNGVEVLVGILHQILVVDYTSDFITFRACEEALGLLHQLPLSSSSSEERGTKTTTFELLSKPESMRCMAIMLQRASADTRLYTVTILRKLAKTDYDWNFVIQLGNQLGGVDVDFFKSLFELVSDEICTSASSCALEVLIEILSKSKKSRLRAIEAGAVCVLVEVLPDSNRSRCEKMLLLIKLLCECAEGRLGFVEHGLGIAAITKKMLQVSNAATKLVVKILWLVCNFHPTERVLDDMLTCGAVKKLLALLHIDGRSSTKDKVVKIFKLQANYWSRYPCFPSELKDYLGFVNT